MTDTKGYLQIEHSDALSGSCDISTSKNAVLPILAASLMTDETVTIRKVPNISDVYNMVSLLKIFGAKVTQEGDTLSIITSLIKTTSPHFHMAGKLRASFLFMGPLLAREGSIIMPLPGGCKIGIRPVDLHLKGLKALGTKIITASGHVLAWRKSLTGAVVYLDYPSVGATENIIMTACLANGITKIVGGALEPEVVDLSNFLVSMGANIVFQDNGHIVIIGTRKLHGTDYTPIPDRIETGTLMIAAAVTRGNVFLHRADISHLKPICQKLSKAGTKITQTEQGARIVGKGFIPVDIVSSPYPGFPTDMQAQFMAACCVAGGVSTISETVFENRFMHVAELRKMGAQIEITHNTAIISGSRALIGADVHATDLRAGAALCIAGLVAKGHTTIHDIYHLDRGYECIESKFAKLGASIKRL